ALSAATLPLLRSPGVDHAVALVLSLVAIAVGAVTYLLPWHRWHPRATLALVPIALAFISAGNYYGSAQPYAYSLFFVVAFVWVGLTQPRWTSLVLIVPAAAAYATPLLLHPSRIAGGATAVLLVVPV